MRILIATPYLPWPLRSGGNAAQFSALKSLSKDHEFTLVCPVYHASQEESARDLTRELPAVRVRAIWCGAQRPALGRPSSEPVAIRVLRPMVRAARRLLNPSQPTIDRNSNQSRIPYDPMFFLPQPFIEALADELKGKVDLFQAEFVEMLSLGTWLPSTLPKLFIHHQIQFVYVDRFMATVGDMNFGHYATAFTRERELACLRYFDGVVTFSDVDRKYLADLENMPPVFTSPFPVPADVGIAASPPVGFSGVFSFLGSEEHYPNCDALGWLLETIWPAIVREIADAQLLVIGRWSEVWAEKASMYASSIKFTGFVSDLGEAMRGGIQIIPLRIGSGIRTKILAALAQGVPCVATTVAAEGLQLERDGGVVIADDEIGLVNAAVSLARNPTNWATHAAGGIGSVSKNYSTEAVRARRNEVYSHVVEANRAQNLA